MVDFTQIVTIGSTIVLIIGGIYTLKQQIKKSKEDSQKAIIEAIQKEISPIQVTVTKDRELFLSNLNEKEKAINDLWIDLDKLEDDLNKLQLNVAKNTGVIDMFTPMMNEVKIQLSDIRNKIEKIQEGLNEK